MKKRVFALFLSLFLCVSLLPATLAAPAAEFSDVPAGSWFEKGVAACAEKGIMVGTGQGLFSPELELSAAECLTLAVRLYDLQRGGAGTLEKASEDWGKYTLTLADGTTWTRYGETNSFFYDGYSTPGYPGGVYFVSVLTPGNTTEERMAWARAHEGSATFTAEGVAYSGTVTADSGDYYGPELRFTSEELPNTEEPLSNCKPGPDRWYRDAVYTAERWDLREAEGFSTLLALLSNHSPETFRADREVFAKALATAAGELEKKYDVPSIPDVERGEYNASIYSLYEAGILNGQDSFGTFWGEKDLTRAEAAVMVLRVLDPSQRLTAPPAAPNGYEQAVIDLRTSFGYYNEETYEADDCTLFVYDRGGMMNAPSGMMTLLYKPGSQPGDGHVLDLPFVRSGWKVTPADTLDFDPQGGKLTYTYFYETNALDSSLPNDDQGVESGSVTFTVDLPSGDIRREHRPVDYAGAMAHVTRRRIVTSSENSHSREVVETLETPECTVVLTRGRFFDDADDYILSLVYKPGSTQGEGTIKRLLLPTTVDLHSWYNPTDRAPDTLELSKDGKALTYSYTFGQALEGFHEAGTYTYTVDLPTGELSVEHAAL